MDSIEQVQDALRHPQVRLQAVQSLVRRPDWVRQLVLDLLAVVGDQDEEFAAWVDELLESLREPPAERSAEFSRWVDRDDHEGAAFWAATFLGRIGGDDSASGEALARVLAAPDRSIDVRCRCAWALGRRTTLAPDGLAALELGLASDHPRLRRTSERAISAHA